MMWKRLLGWSLVTATLAMFGRPAAVHAAISDEASDVRGSNDDDFTFTDSQRDGDGEAEPERGVITGVAFPMGLRLSPVSGKLGLFMNLGASVLLGERLSLGLEAHGLLARFGEDIRGPQGERYSLGMGYVGATSGVTLWRPGRFELVLEGLVGVGSACLSDRDVDDDCPDSNSCVDRVSMFVTEPALALYVHTGPNFRLGLKGGYRFVKHQAWRSPNHFDLSGGFGGLELQWGAYGPRRQNRR
jgi:hypothetical protein